MAIHHLDRSARDRAVEQSLIAAIQISDVIRDLRSDAPGLVELITMLLGRQDRDHLQSRRDLLANSQLASLSFRAAASSGQMHDAQPTLERILDLVLQISRIGLNKFSKDDLSVIPSKKLFRNTHNLLLLKKKLQTISLYRELSRI